MATPQENEARLQAEHISLVDVNLSTIEWTWPLLLTALDNVDFIAVDLELSGLGLQQRKKAMLAEDKYKTLREVASTYSIVSMGVACFQWQPETTLHHTVCCTVQVFNVWLLSQHPYTIDPLSAQFLLQHDFDFNKQLRHGIPYTPRGGANQSCDSCKSHHSKPCFPHLFHRLLLSPAPLVLHNGWTDLLFLYYACHAPLPPTSDSTIADLAEMLEYGGVYDTKAITRYQLHYEERSYLEYVFKQAFVRNQRSQGVWLQLTIPQYEVPDNMLEKVSLPRIPDIPETELMEIQLCRTFTNHGWCNISGCGQCHDITKAILQEEYQLLQRSKRKRKRSRKGSHTSDSTVPKSALLTELFQQELSKAKAAFMTGDAESCDPADRSCERSKGSCEPFKRSCGHRSGFDAFMTGFTFACYALDTRKHALHSTHPSHPHTSHPLSTTELLDGLAEMRNCLNNSNQSVPVRVAHSQFSKRSEGHRAVWQRVKQSQPDTQHQDTSDINS